MSRSDHSDAIVFSRPQDLRAHTTMSDGDLPLSEVAEIALSKGVEIGIADHVSTRNTKRFVASVAAVGEYLEALEGATVFRSAEFCWCDTLWSDLPEEVMARFDYRIGSNHGFWLPDGSMGSPWWQKLPEAWASRPDDLMEVMVRNISDMVRSMPIEIVAHSTLLPPALLALEADPEAWWTEAREERFIEALLESGVAVEISNRYKLPHDRLLRKAREAGASFTFGSDGHRREQIASLEWASAAAVRAGIGPEQMFVPERSLAISASFGERWGSR
jgi:histidinol phosphatase-like PHP family hydrolase